MNNNVLSMLGLAARARKLISGEEQVIKEIRKNNIKLVLLSEDASEQTKKKISDKCNYYRVPLREFGSRNELGQAIGKAERVVIGLTEIGFAKKLIQLTDQ